LVGYAGAGVAGGVLFIYATMLWLAVLAIGLLRAESTIAPRQPGKPTVTTPNQKTEPLNS